MVPSRKMSDTPCSQSHASHLRGALAGLQFLTMRISMKTLVRLSFAVAMYLPMGIVASAQKAVDIPSGTVIRIRMIDKLNSEEAQVNDTFRATLEDPIQVAGREIYPKGADVMGRITDVHRSGRLSEPGELDLALVTISSRT